MIQTLAMKRSYDMLYNTYNMNIHGNLRIFPLIFKFVILCFYETDFSHDNARKNVKIGSIKKSPVSIIRQTCNEI